MSATNLGDRGELALVLHSHMPYVEGFGTWPFGEEWLWEAWSECYARLFPVLEGHAVTLGVTPVLADQLEAMRGAPGDRMLAWLRDTRDRYLKEDIDGFERAGERRTAAALERLVVEYRAAAERFETGYQRDVIGAVRRLGESGIELWTSAYTHAVLPLLATDLDFELQLALAVTTHERRFGKWDGGFWLPECAYTPGIERELAARGVRWFCTDQSPRLGVGGLDNLEPVALPGGVTAVPIDWEMIELVWDENGYPRWGPYRDSWRRTFKNHMPWRNDGDPYDAEIARKQADDHASLLVKRIAGRLDRYAKQRDRPGLLTLAFDTELMGHWWYEGPWFLESVFRHLETAGIRLSTVSDALTRVEPVTRELAAGSWGEHKDLSTWDSPRVADVAWRTRGHSLRFYDALDRDPDGLDHAACVRTARELLALQSSDWSFKIAHETAGDYARTRFEGHIDNIERSSSLMSQSAASIPHGPAGERTVDEHLASLAPDLDFDTLRRFRCEH